MFAARPLLGGSIWVLVAVGCHPPAAPPKPPPPAPVDTQTPETTPQTTPETTPDSTPSTPIDCGPEDPFSIESLTADIEYLASDALGGRAPGTEGDEETLSY